MLSNLESNYGIAFGGSDDSSSSSYKPDRNTPVGAFNRGPDRTATESRIENNPGREWNPTEDCTGATVEAVATAVVSARSAKGIASASAGATLTGSAIKDAVDECTTPIVPGMPTVPRQ